MAQKPEQPKEEKEKNRLKALWLFLLNKKNLPLVASLLGGTAVVTTSAILLAPQPTSSSQPSSEVSSSSSSSTPSSSESSVTSSSTPVSSEENSSSSSEATVQYTVTFDAMGGSSVESQTVNEGSLLAEPTSTYGIMSVEGWYTSDDDGATFLTAWDFATDTVTNDLTLYANWEDPLLTRNNPLTVGTATFFVLHATNELWGWGESGSGELGVGNGITSYRAISIPLNFLDNDEFVIHTVSYGNSSAVLTNLGNVYVFGANSSGMLGFDPSVRSYVETPEKMPLDNALNVNETVIDIQISSEQFFLLTSQGRVLATGSNLDGYLGINSDLTTDFFEPVEVIFSDFVPNERVVKIQHNRQATFVITNFARVFAWGDNNSNRLGNNDINSDDTTAPQEIFFDGLQQGEYVVDIQNWYRTGVALTNLGRVYGWGRTRNGQLATGEFDGPNFIVPTLIDLSFLAPSETIIQIASGTDHTGFLTDTGVVYLVGRNNSFQLGTGTDESQNLPVILQLDTVLNVGETVSSIALGDELTFIYTTEGRVFGLGNNSSKQLRFSIEENFNSPIEIPFVSLNLDETFLDADVAESHGIALTSTNRVLVWGNNDKGQLGLGESVSIAYVPTFLNLPLTSNEVVTNVYAENESSFALTSDNRLFGWGENQLGTLGIGTLNNQFEPMEVSFPDFALGETIDQFYVSIYENYVLTSTGRVFGWGGNVMGTLGDGTSFGTVMPVLLTFADIQGGETIEELFIGKFERFAKTSSDRIYAWGYNQTYGLGLNDTNDRLQPTLMTFAELQPLETIVSITPGLQNALALTSTGRILGWGFNLSSQLGDEGTSMYQTPTVINYSLDGQVTTIYSNSNSGFYLITDQQTVYTFGLNPNGQLGLGDLNDRPTPTVWTILELHDAEYVTKLSFSQYSGFAITSEGRLFVWGQNNQGKLGLVTEAPLFLNPTRMTF